MDLSLRILAILFPMFALVGTGYFYGRRHESDMSVANRLNMDVFITALVFSALANKSFDLANYGGLALAMVIMILGSGAVGWAVARMTGIRPLTLSPTLMFNNSVNLGVPLAVLTFGPDVLPLAVVLFVVSTTLHFSLGVWLLDHHAKLGNLWMKPVVLATVAGLAVGSLGVPLWEPLALSVKMLGDISIPLALFSLGVRLTDGALHGWRVGLVGAVARPLAGMALAWAAARGLGLNAQQSKLMLLYGALPPAVMNYVFAERYHQEPDKVASIVLVGNLASVVFLPIALALVL
ncbi:AEC family transporter [Denitratisoma sp. DHT3]|uniref:AEC family transporter n=1 Tax=Denitratisoma sp. DHT3 TaxID=1981880 RepID=UPI001C98617A|nr:AEC family transporter [Denitratisoma sp. DHT3]